MLTQHIALVAENDAVSPSELARVSAALQRQVTRDLGPTWGITGTVDAFPALEDVPIGYWPVVVVQEPLGAEQGVHLDRDGQPHARIEVSLAWSIDASRACLEMLVDPFGSRTTLGLSPRGERDVAEVLVEVCAPCAGVLWAYEVNDVLVSDFCTPLFYGGLGRANGTRYSWNGSCDAPLQVLQGGHLTWYEMAEDAWWTRSLHGDNAIDACLGVLRAGASVRGLVRERAPLRAPQRRVPLAIAAQLQARRRYTARAAAVRAERLRGLSLETQIQTPASTVALPAHAPREAAWNAALHAAPEISFEREQRAFVADRARYAVEPARAASSPRVDRTPARTQFEPANTLPGAGRPSPRPSEPLPASELQGDLASARLGTDDGVHPIARQSSVPRPLPSTSSERYGTAIRPSLAPSLAERTSSAPHNAPDSLSPTSAAALLDAPQKSYRRSALVLGAAAAVFSGAALALLLDRVAPPPSPRVSAAAPAPVATPTPGIASPTPEPSPALAPGAVPAQPYASGAPLVVAPAPTVATKTAAEPTLPSPGERAANRDRAAAREARAERRAHARASRRQDDEASGEPDPAPPALTSQPLPHVAAVPPRLVPPALPRPSAEPVLTASPIKTSALAELLDTRE